MLANQKFGAVERTRAEIGMIDARKRDEVLVEQRQVGRCGRSGHVSTPVNVPREGAKRLKRLIDPRRPEQGGDRVEPARREAYGDLLAGLENVRGFTGSLAPARRRQRRWAGAFGSDVRTAERRGWTERGRQC